MGVTSFDIPIIEKYLPGVKSVCELGAQNNYSQPHLPAPYMREWYEAKGVLYHSIDLSGECGASVIDLSEEFDGIIIQSGLVTDFGTSEHVSDYYNCWLNKWNLCEVGGVIISENPKRGNWPGHGFNYITKGFYNILCFHADANIVEYGEHPAMGNVTDGWNVWCVLRKYGTRFPSREEFEKLPVYKQ